MDEAAKAFRLLYPTEVIDLESFLREGIKRFYCAEPKRGWLNCLSEKELQPTTLKMRTEVPIADITRLLLNPKPSNLESANESCSSDLLYGGPPAGTSPARQMPQNHQVGAVHSISAANERHLN